MTTPATLRYPPLLLDLPPRLQLAQTPTPLHPLPRLSKLLGARLYCKRDDLTGFGFGGNKIRKLEYLLSDAVQRGCESLITCGSNQSNWCCMVAVAGAALGMQVHLVLGGPVPKIDTGNLRLSRLAGAQMSHIDTPEDAVLEAQCQQLEASLLAQGRRPYRMIMGGSNGLGAFGYSHAIAEVMEYEQHTGIRFSKLVHATGSAGTQAGLIVGGLLHGWQGEIIGMAVSRARNLQEEKVRGVLAQILPPQPLAAAKVIVDDAFVGGGYRQKTAGCTEAIELFARVEGIFLDEAYTGKAAAGLIEYARSGRFRDDEHVLFLHTGGAAQLFE